jgi:hypothetical protein
MQKRSALSFPHITGADLGQRARYPRRRPQQSGSSMGQNEPSMHCTSCSRPECTDHKQGGSMAMESVSVKLVLRDGSAHATCMRPRYRVSGMRGPTMHCLKDISAQCPPISCQTSNPSCCTWRRGATHAQDRLKPIRYRAKKVYAVGARNSMSSINEVSISIGFAPADSVGPKQ